MGRSVVAVKKIDLETSDRFTRIQPPPPPLPNMKKVFFFMPSVCIYVTFAGASTVGRIYSFSVFVKVYPP
jgi:hypothetical protein